MKTETLLAHMRYTAWASGRLVEAAGKLSDEELRRDFKTSDHSVLGTLVHVYAADRVWLHRVRGTPRATFIDAEDQSMEVLRKHWPPIHNGWQKLLEAETDASVLRKVPYKDLRGNAHETPLWQIILHVVNHGSHHRGQVSGMLRTMGHTPPILDLIFFYRENG
jgi:uncharacterized damage-inducible protein DinB